MEYTKRGATIYPYFGQQFIHDFAEEAPYSQTNFLLKQILEIPFGPTCSEFFDNYFMK